MNKKPNLVLFGIDSLRADHMSLYGYKHQTTPNITNMLRMRWYSTTAIALIFRLHPATPPC